LKLQYDSRLEEWEKEKQAGYARLHAEIAAERVRLTEALRSDLAEEREKASARDRQQNAQRMRRVEEEAIARAAEFASRLLSRLAGPDLERPICDAVVEDLSRLPKAQRGRLREVFREDAAVVVKVMSAHPLDPGRREGLARALGDLAGGPVACEFEENPELRAGLAISVGPWLLRANLRDELAFLTAGARHAG
jgi:F-type H+-transporting ATPase subunit b